MRNAIIDNVKVVLFVGDDKKYLMIVHDKSTNDNWRHNSKTVVADVALWTWKTHWLKNYIKQVLINWSQKAGLATPNFIVEN